MHIFHDIRLSVRHMPDVLNRLNPFAVAGVFCGT